MSKGIVCSVTGCGKPAIRSVPSEKIGKAQLPATLSRRGYLCRSHYRDLKRKLKTESTLERWRQAA